MNPLKKKRVSLGLNQTQIADKLNTTVATVNRYEDDKRCPHLKVLMKIARAYQMTNEELIEYIEYCEEKENGDEK